MPSDYSFDHFLSDQVLEEIFKYDFNKKFKAEESYIQRAIELNTFAGALEPILPQKQFELIKKQTLDNSEPIQ